MRYKIASGIEIRTENAAKPESQASAYLVDLMKGLRQVRSTFDYGCGKLRYQATIAESTDTLAIVDSELQLSRTQMVGGAYTSIRQLHKHSNRVQVFNDLEFAKARDRFDRGFCINVLSVIPSYQRRSQVLRTIHQRLRRGGECLFVVQYRNSDFNRMKKLANARPWLDGFLIDSLRGHSFYGMITPDRLQRGLKRAGFRICAINLNEGSAYCWAVRP